MRIYILFVGVLATSLAICGFASAAPYADRKKNEGDPILARTIRMLFDRISAAQQLEDEPYVGGGERGFPPKQWAKNKGLFPSDVHVNFHGDPVSGIFRKLFSIPDNNAYVTAVVTDMLLEARELVDDADEDAPFVEDQLRMATSAILEHRDRNYKSGDPIFSFWKQQKVEKDPGDAFDLVDKKKGKKSKAQYAAYPENLAEPLRAGVRLADMARAFANATHTLDHLEEQLKQLELPSVYLRGLRIPADADDTATALALTGRLACHHKDYPQAAKEWIKKIGGAENVAKTLSAFAYRPFSKDEEENTIDPRTYFWLRKFIDAEAEKRKKVGTYDSDESDDSWDGVDKKKKKDKGREALAVVATWLQQTSDAKENFHRGYTMPFTVNNIDLTVAVTSLYGLAGAVVAEEYGVFGEGALVDNIDDGEWDETSDTDTADELEKIATHIIDEAEEIGDEIGDFLRGVLQEVLHKNSGDSDDNEDNEDGFDVHKRVRLDSNKRKHHSNNNNNNVHSGADNENDDNDDNGDAVQVGDKHKHKLLGKKKKPGKAAKWFDKDLRGVFDGTARVVQWAIESDQLNSRPDLALPFFPSKFAFYFFAGRLAHMLGGDARVADVVESYDVLEDAQGGLLHAMRKYGTAQILDKCQGIVPKPKCAGACGGGDGGDECPPEDELDQLAKLDSRFAKCAYFEEFLGNADTFGKIKWAKHEDRLFSTAMAANALMDTWTETKTRKMKDDSDLVFGGVNKKKDKGKKDQGDQHRVNRKWLADTPKEVVDAVEISLLFVAHAISRATHATSIYNARSNAFFSVSARSADHLPHYYPATDRSFVNGTKVTCDFDPGYSDEIFLGVSGHVDPDEYAKMLDSECFGRKVPMEYGDPNEAVFPYWSSHTFTDAAAALALSKWAALERSAKDSD